MQRLQRKVDGRCDGACPCRENISKLFIILICGMALLAYFIYNIYRYATQPSVTVVTYLNQNSLATPGMLICPPDYVDTTRQYGVFPQVFFQTLTSDYETLNNNCTLYPVNAPPTPCAVTGSFVSYAFSTVETTKRTCYDVPPGATTMSDPRDSMWINYVIYQAANVSLPNNGLTVSNNLFFGLYTDASDRASAPIRLASAAGITVVSFQVDQYTTLSGSSTTQYSVFSSSSSPSRPEASLVIGVNSTFPGTNIPTPPARIDTGCLIIQPSALVITDHAQQHVFGWTDVIGAIGGVFSIIASIKVFFNGQESDPEDDKGFIKRVFYSSEVSPEQAADSDMKGAKLNSELEELRRRAQYTNADGAKTDA